MSKSLVIVESPAKAKTINKYLGKQYLVKSSVGHIRDLPTGKRETSPKFKSLTAAEVRKLPPEEKERYQAEKERAKLIHSMGVDPYSDWQADYQIMAGKEKVVDELKKLAAKSDEIYLATDLDREGEAIAWHLREIIGGEPEKFKRVVFNEITKKAIKEAFVKPASLDMDRVNAQQARRFLDRVVGFMVSPLLWKKVARGLSAGRVQSVAVKLVVEKERDISAFQPEEFWDIHSHLKVAEQEPLVCKLLSQNGKNITIPNKEVADKARSVLQSSPHIVKSVETKPSQSRPSAPFITSTLQQAASTRLRFGVKKTMMLAQRLYEAGYITYMRTDSTALSADALTMSREWIAENCGEKYLPESANIYKSKSGAQEAHEAIRPTDVNLEPAALAGAEADAQKLYDLIRRQFIACQMMPALYDVTQINIDAADYGLRAKGRVLKFDGWTRVLSPLVKGDDALLPEVKQGQTLVLDKVETKQHFTKPPARYTEASLVKELEKRGIGRPSTYASIISTIQDRGYVRLEARRFYAEKMGEIVTDRLDGSFEDLMDYSFTAMMEERLDSIAEGRESWKDALNKFFDGFTKRLELANKPDDEGGMAENRPTEVDISCPTCERAMAVRTASTGVFLGCTGYNLPPKERCKTTINLVPGDETIAADQVNNDEAELNELRKKKRCPVCGTAMDSYLVNEETRLHICGNNPDCSGHVIEKGKFKIKGYDGPVIECDKCQSEMQLKNGRFGKYFGCTNDECKNTRKLLKDGTPAPPKADPVPMPELKCTKSDAYFVLRDGASGIFLAAHDFPKSRETRAPLVSELIPHKDELDPKHRYLTNAPVADKLGNPALIRYSRKAKEQYIASENDGKDSGWRVYYRDGKWEEASPPKGAK
ncbi:MAG: DNA topoisomerase I subunit omega [Kangiellaceae bacterium]|nr:DNA topoisomerase I subunit omega [Kangiellaceae bacterium]